MLLKNAFEMIKNFKSRMAEAAWDSEPSMVPFGLFGLISLPLFYFINLYFLDPNTPAYNHKGDLVLRSACAFLCFILTLKDHWPKAFRSYLPVVWYSAIFLFMPFFATYKALESHFSAAWLLNSLSILILTMLLVEWATYAFLLFMGLILGTLTYYLITPHAFPFSMNTQPLTLIDVLITYGVSIIMGIVFIRRKDLVEYTKLQAMKTVGASIAHELRTPLASFESGVKGIKRYFPVLLETYILAQKTHVNIPEIPASHFEIFTTLLNELEEEVKYSNVIIDMLLMKAKQRDFNKSNFTLCSINDCIEDALARYPFKEGELQLIHWDNRGNFNFQGEPLLILHVFFNLIKNALYFIEQAGKGNIKIWYEHSAHYNIVHFKDTALGIPEHLMSKIFQGFYSQSNKGTGLGLTFCKMVTRSLEGDIKCFSVYKEFTDFVLYFPKVVGEARYVMSNGIEDLTIA